MRISDWSSDVCSSDLLFIMVAESTEILAPMSQFGWATAWAGVAAAIAAMLAVRNGPPDAVRMMRSMASGWAVSKTWKMEIGRASCRERVCQYVSISVVAVSLKKKNNVLYMFI